MAIGNSVDANQTGFQSLTAGGSWNGRTLTAGGGVSITNGDGTAGNPTVSALSSSSIFSAYQSATTANVTGNNTNAVVVFDTTTVNTGANYNTATGLYTAPATGTYFFNTTVEFTNVGAAHTSGTIVFFTNAGTPTQSAINFNVAAIRDSGNVASFSTSAIMQLTIGDTINVEVNVRGGTQVVGISGSATVRTTNFGGFRIT